LLGNQLLYPEQSDGASLDSLSNCRTHTLAASLGELHTTFNSNSVFLWFSKAEVECWTSKTFVIVSVHLPLSQTLPLVSLGPNPDRSILVLKSGDPVLIS
jgi:hypothetical protein